MSNNQKKANIAELVGPLLKRLKLAKERVPENSEIEKTIDQISTEVVKIKDILDSKENLIWELAGYLGKIERQIDPLMDHKPREKAPNFPHNATIIEEGESSNTSYEKDERVSKFREFINVQDPRLGKCLKSLCIFPENTVLKKRLVIYWWIVLFWDNVEYYERFISNLVNMGVLIAVHREHNKVIDRFKIEPIVHKWLISNSGRYGRVSSEKGEEGTWRLYENVVLTDFLYFGMLLNLDQRYLNSKDITEISSKHEYLEVVQFGNWRYTETEIQETRSKETKSKDHIEVNQTDFLQKLGKHMTYLSLRGISGIVELNESIGKLGSLKILDLRACHNLEKLPQKLKSTLDDAWFKNLKVLDISECYLLDHMPKWICELSNLEVLKGFVIGSLENKNRTCRLVDISKLNKLRKLSIRIAINILGKEVFEGFNSLNSLLVLTITWGEIKYKEIPNYSLPKNIEKLDIRCYPEA